MLNSLEIESKAQYATEFILKQIRLFYYENVFMWLTKIYLTLLQLSLPLQNLKNIHFNYFTIFTI